MFERILFPTDFSVYANAVTACLPSLQSAGVSEVILLHVIRARDVPLPETYNLESYNFIHWSVEEQLNLLRMLMEGHGLRVRTRIEYGSPVSEIIRVASEENVSMIMIGAQGTTLSSELMIGSTAYEVIRRSSVPVLLEKAEVVREEGHNRCRWACAEMFHRILHPTDFSEGADDAYRRIETLWDAGTREVILLHVQDERILQHLTESQIKNIDQEDRSKLEERSQHLSDIGFRSRWLLQYGNPAKETLRIADEINPGLIILASQGRSAINEFLTGSTTETIIRLVKHPVLIIRAPKRKDT